MVTTLEKIVLMAGVKVSGKKAPTATANIAASRAYSTMSWARRSPINFNAARLNLVMFVIVPRNLLAVALSPSCSNSKHAARTKSS